MLPRVLADIAALVAVIVAAVVGYLVGHRDHQPVTTRVGVAYASQSQAEVTVGGWSYGIPLNVPWIDSQGELHYGSRPSCLPANRQSRIVFGTVNVSAIGQRSVVWVRCEVP